MLSWGQVVGDDGPAQLAGDGVLRQGPVQHAQVPVPSADHQSSIVDGARRVLGSHPLQHLQIAGHLRQAPETSACHQLESGQQLWPCVQRTRKGCVRPRGAGGILPLK